MTHPSLHCESEIQGSALIVARLQGARAKVFYHGEDAGAGNAGKINRVSDDPFVAPEQGHRAPRIGKRFRILVGLGQAPGKRHQQFVRVPGKGGVLHQGFPRLIPHFRILERVGQADGLLGHGHAFRRLAQFVQSSFDQIENFLAGILAHEERVTAGY
jgi:hypothetical protein